MPLREGASNLFGRGLESPKIASCSGATPRLHRCKSGLLESKTHFWGFRGFLLKRLFAPSLIDFRAKTQKTREGCGCPKFPAGKVSGKFLAPHQRRRFFVNFFPKTFRLPYPFPIEGIFRESLGPRASEHTPGTNKHRGNSPVGALRGFLILPHRFGRGFPQNNGVDFYSEAGVDFVWIFSALFSLSQKIHAKSTPESTPKSTPILKTFFPLVFLGARGWFTSLQLDAHIYTSINQDSQVCHFMLGTSSDKNKRWLIQWIYFQRENIHAQSTLHSRSPNKFRRCWKMIPRFSGSAKCYPCQGLATFRQGKRLLENWPRLRKHRRDLSQKECPTAFKDKIDHFSKGRKIPGPNFVHPPPTPAKTLLGVGGV